MGLAAVEEHDDKGMAWLEFLGALTAWIHDHRESHLAWLAERDGEAYGMAWLAITDRVPGPSTWTRLAGVIQSVYVRPQHRNDGIGAALVQATIVEAGRLGFDYWRSTQASGPSRYTGVPVSLIPTGW